jgi:hypothetical protein
MGKHTHKEIKVFQISKTLWILGCTNENLLSPIWRQENAVMSVCLLTHLDDFNEIW